MHPPLSCKLDADARFYDRRLAWCPPAHPLYSKLSQAVVALREAAAEARSPRAQELVHHADIWDWDGTPSTMTGAEKP